MIMILVVMVMDTKAATSPQHAELAVAADAVIFTIVAAVAAVVATTTATTTRQ